MTGSCAYTKRFLHKLAPMIRREITVLACVCLVLAAVPVAIAAGATSDTPSQAIADCYSHSQLTAHYSTGTLRQALVQMPADVREYSDCFDVIERQLFAQQGGGSGSSGTPAASSSGSVIPTPLLIVIVLLALAAVTFGALAIRRRRAEGPDDAAQGGPDGPGGSGPATGA